MDVGDLAPQCQGRRKITRIFQHAVGGTQLFGHQGILLQIQGAALAGKVVEFAPLPCLGDTRLGDTVDQPHWGWSSFTPILR